MNNDHRFPIMIAGLAAALALAVATPVAFAATKAHAATKAKAAEPQKPVGQVVEYPELEHRIGETLAIETTFKTTRTGKLIKYTQPALTLQMGTGANPMDLTVPRETIKTITVLAPAAATPAAEPAKDTGTSGAKKN